MWTTPSGKVRAGTTYKVVVAEPGTQTFSVTASNSSDRATASVTVQASEPRIEAGNERPVLDNNVVTTPSEGTIPLKVTFTARASDPNGDKLDYIWDFGDGEITGGGASISHTYEDSGYYPVKVVVSDGRGGVDTAETEVTANPPPATIKLNVTPDNASWEISNYYYYDDDDYYDYDYSYFKSGTGDATIELPSEDYYEVYVYADGYDEGYDGTFLEAGETRNISVTLEANETPIEPSPPSEPSPPTEPSPPSEPSPPTEPSPPSEPSPPTEPSPPSEQSPPTEPSPPSEPSPPTEPVPTPPTEPG